MLLRKVQHACSSHSWWGWFHSRDSWFVQGQGAFPGHGACSSTAGWWQRDDRRRHRQNQKMFLARLHWLIVMSMWVFVLHKTFLHNQASDEYLLTTFINLFIFQQEYWYPELVGTLGAPGSSFGFICPRYLNAALKHGTHTHHGN